MAVHFKFKSAKDYDSIGLDGHFISVGDLKQAIVTSKGLGKGADFDLLLTNAQTNEEYEDEAFLIPKNTSVIVKRVPSTRPKGFNAAVRASSVPVPTPATAPASRAPAAPPSAPTMRTDIDRDLSTAQSAAAPAEQAAAGDEASKILAMVTETAADWQRQTQQTAARTQFSGRGARGGFQRGGFQGTQGRTPPPGYVCHRCGQPGHFISQCPTNGDTSYDVRRVKFPVGIPRSMLVPNAQGSLLLPSGEVASIRPNEAAFAKQTVGLPSSRGQDGLSPELACPLCEGLFRDAVMIPCCQNSFCDSCIRDYLLEHGECPSCGAKNVKNDSLLPNLTLRKAIDGYMRTIQTQMKMTPASKPGLPAASANTLAVASAPGSPDGQAQAVRSAGAASAARSAASLMRTSASATSEVEGADDSVSVAPVDKSQVRPNGQHAVSGDGQLSPPSSGGVGVEPMASVANARVPDDTQPGLADARKASNKPALSTHTGGSVGLEDAIATVQVESPAKRAKLAEKVERRCFNCGSAGHVARECPNRPPTGMPPRPFFEPGILPGMMMPPGGMDPMFGMMPHGFPGMPFDGPRPFYPGMGFMPHPGHFPPMGPGPGFPGFMGPPRMPMGPPHASWAGRPPLSKEEFLRLQAEERRKRRAVQSRSAGAPQSDDDEQVPSSRSRHARPEQEAEEAGDVGWRDNERKRRHAAQSKPSSRTHSDDDVDNQTLSRSRHSRLSSAEEEADAEQWREEERRIRPSERDDREYGRQSSDDHQPLPSRSRHARAVEGDNMEPEDDERRSRRTVHNRDHRRPLSDDHEPMPSRSRSRHARAVEEAEMGREEEERRSRRLAHNRGRARPLSDDPESLPSRSRHGRTVENGDMEWEESRRSLRMAYSRDSARPLNDDYERLPSRSRHARSAEDIDAERAEERRRGAAHSKASGSVRSDDERVHSHSRYSRVSPAEAKEYEQLRDEEGSRRRAVQSRPSELDSDDDAEPQHPRPRHSRSAAQDDVEAEHGKEQARSTSRAGQSSRASRRHKDGDKLRGSVYARLGPREEDAEERWQMPGSAVENPMDDHRRRKSNSDILKYADVEGQEMRNNEEREHKRSRQAKARARTSYTQ